MGVDIVSTRPISQGEQIFISYSGDETIEDTWGEVFSCYCCHCQKSCLVRGDGPLGRKRKEPVSHQDIRESESEQSPKKDRLRFHTPDKRKREDEETMDLEPVNLTSTDVSLTSGSRSPDETDGVAGSVTPLYLLDSLQIL